jgi:hypothetical protein
MLFNFQIYGNFITIEPRVCSVLENILYLFEKNVHAAVVGALSI